MQNKPSFTTLLAMTILVVATLLMQGCGNQIDCNDDKTKSTAIDIIQSKLNNAVWYREISTALSGTPELTNIKVLSRNDDLKQAQCTGTYSFTYNSKPRTIDVAYDLAYLQDKKDTEVTVAMDNITTGFITMVQREQPIKNGVEKILDPNTGNLLHSIEWKNGIEDGVERIYNPASNKLIAEIHVSQGKKAGSEKGWNADGSILLVNLNWVNDKPTGFQKEYNYAGDKLITNLTIKDGLLTGFQTTGDLKSNYDEYEWKDGLYDGIHKSYRWDSSGIIHLVTVEHYKAGKLDGLQQLYNPDGNVGRIRMYKDGIEVPADTPAVTPAASATPTAATPLP